MGNKSRKFLRALTLLGGGICLLLLMMYMAGLFSHGKIGPENRGRPAGASPDPRKSVSAVVERIPEYYEAVGTVRPQRETRIEAQVTARIEEIKVGPGDRVKKGDVIIVLDDREAEARLGQARQGVVQARARKSQARQAVSAAEAAHTQASQAYKRVKTYFASQAATTQDLEEADSRFRQSEARLEQAREALKEAEAGILHAGNGMEQARIGLDHCRIPAPEGGEVVKRLAEPGDLAFPGKALLSIQSRGTLRLEALVREGLIHRVVLGQDLEVVMGALGRSLAGQVVEVVPSADPRTRTFLVKVGLPTGPDLYPGMFGRLRVPIDDRKAVLLPLNALSRIGQLEMVTVREGDRWERVYVTTGRVINDRVEILSGLEGGEIVALQGEENG